MRRVAATILIALSLCGYAAADVPVAGSVAVLTQPAESQPAIRYWIGVAVEPIPAPMSHLLALQEGQGLLVSRVIDNSPAARAGLQKDDLLIAIDEQPLGSARQLMLAIQSDSDVPTARKIKIIRAAERRDVTVTPDLRPVEFQVTGVPSQQVILPNGAYLNVGPGYVITGNQVAMQKIQQITKGGETFILSQSADSQGHVRNTIAVGNKLYEVTPETLATLPVELQPIAQQMLGTAATQSSSELDAKKKRLKELEEEQRKLQQEIDGNDKK